MSPTSIEFESGLTPLPRGSDPPWAVLCGSDVSRDSGAVLCGSDVSRDSIRRPSQRATGGRLLRLFLLAAASAVAAACASSGAKPDAAAAVPPGPDPVAVTRYEDALATLQAGDELQAEAKLQALADAHPDYSGPLVNLAVLRARRNEVEPATALLERAIAVCTRCAAPWNELGVLQRRQGRFADAEQSYLKAVAADPAYASAYFNLGVLYELYLQRPELALDQYARFRELDAADPAGSDVDKWIADLKRRTKAVERSAQAEEVK